MNFHAIMYAFNSKTLYGYCYHEKTIVYKEVLRKEWVRNVENLHLQYMLAVKFPDKPVALNIGKGNDTEFKKEAKKLRKDKSKSSLDNVMLLQCANASRQPISSRNATSSIEPASKSNDSNFSTANKKAIPISTSSLSSFKSVDKITFYQGAQHKCYEYSLLSSLDNLIAYYKFMMRNSSEIICKKLEALKDDIFNTSKELMYSGELLHNIKERMDLHYWSTQKLTTKKAYLLTNFSEFIEFCRTNCLCIIVVRIDDLAGNNNHWVSINNSYIFNTTWKQPKPLSKENLMSCAEHGNYKKLGEIMM